MMLYYVGLASEQDPVYKCVKESFDFELRDGDTIDKLVDMFRCADPGVLQEAERLFSEPVKPEIMDVEDELVGKRSVF